MPGSLVKWAGYTEHWVCKYWFFLAFLMHSFLVQTYTQLTIPPSNSGLEYPNHWRAPGFLPHLHPLTPSLTKTSPSTPHFAPYLSQWFTKFPPKRISSTTPTMSRTTIPQLLPMARRARPHQLPKMTTRRVHMSASTPPAFATSF